MDIGPDDRAYLEQDAIQSQVVLQVELILFLQVVQLPGSYEYELN
jgi:hypothetical protein